MATLKSQPRNMVYEGKVQVLDKFIVFHRNSGSLPTDTASVLVYGIANAIDAVTKKYTLLIGHVDIAGVIEAGIPLSKGFYKVASATATIVIGDDTRNYVKGDFFYLEKDVQDTGKTGSFYPVSGYTLRSNGDVGTKKTGTCLQSNFTPCHTIYYEIQDIEKLKNFYSAVVTFKLNTDVYGE